MATGVCVLMWSLKKVGLEESHLPQLSTITVTWELRKMNRDEREACKADLLHRRQGSEIAWIWYVRDSNEEWRDGEDGAEGTLHSDPLHPMRDFPAALLMWYLCSGNFSSRRKFYLIRQPPSLPFREILLLERAPVCFSFSYLVPSV